MATDEDDGGKEKKILRKTLLACAIGTSCFYSVSFSLCGLQSSINVREGLGTVCMAIRLASATLGALILSPFVVKRYGPKRGLILSELLDMVFAVANFYPSWYTLPLAAAISGFGSGLIFVASQSILRSIARRSSRGTDVAIETQKYSGIFFGILAIGQMIANGLTQLILRFSFVRQHREPPIQQSSAASVTWNYENSSYHVVDKSACASHDCPAEYAYLEETPRFELLSADQDAVYLLLSVYLVVELVAVFIHCVILPDIPEIDEDEYPDEQSTLSSSRENLIPKKNSSAWMDMCSSVKGVFSHFISPEGLLTFWIQFHFGLSMFFISAEFNRAFVSCVVGVEEVGACSIIVGLMNFLSSAAISRIAPRFGIVSIMVVGLLLEVSNYTASLLWIPSNDTLFLPYVFSIFYGISHGIRRNTSFLIAARYSRDKDSAFAAQSVTICLGGIVSFGWSTPLCVYVKIYVLIALAIFATMCWGVAEYRETRITK